MARPRTKVVDGLSDDGELLGEYLDEWLARRRTQLRPTTGKSYEGVVRCYLRPHLGHVPLRDLDRRRLEALYAELLASGGRKGGPLAPRTVRYVHAVLSRALQDAVLDGVLQVNPARLATPPRHDPATVELGDDLRVWTAAEAARFLQFVDGHPWRALWHLALGTGARRGELLGLRWCDVDFDRSLIRIRRSLTVVDGVPRLLATKTSRSRIVSIGPSLVDALRRHQMQQRRQQESFEIWTNRWDLVFTDDTGGFVDPFAVTMEFRGLVRTADVPIIRLHDCRHTNATLLLQAGVPAKVVSERLGHSTIMMTLDVYSHVLPAMDSDAAERFEDIIHAQSAARGAS